MSHETEVNNHEHDHDHDHEGHHDHDHGDHHKKSAAPLTIPQVFGLGLAGGLVVALIIAGGIGYRMVKNGSESPFAMTAARLLHMSVASVNGTSISYTDYKKDVETVTKFYADAGAEQGPAPTAEQISEQVLSRAMVNIIIEDVADELGAKVKQEDIDAAKEKTVSQFASEDEARKDLMEKYGWTMEEYIQRIVRPILLEQATTEAFQASTDEKYVAYATGEEVRGSHILLQVEDEKSRNDIKKLAEQILTKVKNGESFEELAKQYGSDGTKERGGDLGWFAKGVMVKPFEDAMFVLKDNEIADKLVETEFGYHIVKRTGTRSAKDFNAFMENNIKEATINMYIDVPNPLKKFIEAADAKKNNTAIEIEPQPTEEKK